MKGARGGAASPDLAVAGGLAVLGLLVSLASPGGWAQAVALAPLVLAVPGYAIAAALFPPGSIDPADRVVYSFVFAVAAAALGGLALQLVIDLDRTAWLGLLVTVTLGACAVAHARRAGRRPRLAPGRRWRRPAGTLWAVCLLAAAGVAAAAVETAVRGVHEQQGRKRFASLWAVPARSENGAARVEVGVWSHGTPGTYRLEARRDGEILDSFRLRLGARQRWRTRLSPETSAADGYLRIVLYRGAAPYRSVALDTKATP